MINNYLQAISIIKLHLIQNKVYCYLLKSKECFEFLNILWIEKLIWGYTYEMDFIKVYLKYQNNKSLIYSITKYRKPINIVTLKAFIKHYPQSLFILETNQGLKCHKTCLTNNFTGILKLKIN